MAERRPRLGGAVFWLRAAEWPWSWLTHALGAYATRAWRPRAMRAILEARAVEYDKLRPVAAGLAGTTAIEVGEVMCPPAGEGHYWPDPEWRYLSVWMAGSEAMRVRYPEIITGTGEPKRALGEWNFILSLALGLRGEGSFAYWAISTGAAEDLARRLYLERRVRRELAEDVLGIDLEKLDAQAAEALARSHVEIQHGDGSARSIFTTGRN